MPRFFRMFDLPVPEFLGTFYVPSVDFATWAGDLGSAVAASVIDDERRTPKPTSRYLFSSGTPASAEDLLGDIDGVTIARVLSGVVCGSAPGIPDLAGTTLFGVFDDYYHQTNTPLGRAFRSRFRCFLSQLGGRFSPDRALMNEQDVVDLASTVVWNSAQALYVQLLLSARDYRFIRGIPGGALQAKAILFARAFVTWLARHAKSEG
jgi:hypothetical protein